MNCRDIENNMFAYMEGRLSPEAHEAITKHLEGCSSCSHLVESFSTVEKIIRNEKAREPNPFLATRILLKLENQSDKQSFSLIPALRQAIIASAILAAMAVGFFVGQYGLSMKTPAESGENQIEALKSDFFVHDFVDEDKTLLTFN